MKEMKVNIEVHICLTINFQENNGSFRGDFR